MIYGGWQDSRLVLSILTSISRGYELDSWAFPGLILYGGWIDWWPDIYILSSSTRDRSISRSEYSRGCLHWISLSRGFSRTLTRNLLVSPYVPGLILYGGCQDSWLEIWILSSSRRGIRMAACIEFPFHGDSRGACQIICWGPPISRREIEFQCKQPSKYFTFTARKRISMQAAT